jgi:hypothetical protein
MPSKELLPREAEGGANSMEIGAQELLETMELFWNMNRDRQLNYHKIDT